MIKGLEFGIGMRWQHFAMRVHLNARALRLLQQCVQVHQIVTGNQNALALDCRGPNGRRFGIAKVGRMRSIEHAQDRRIDLSHTQDRFQQTVHIRCRIAQFDENFVNGRHDLGIVAALKRENENELDSHNVTVYSNMNKYFLTNWWQCMA